MVAQEKCLSTGADDGNWVIYAKTILYIVGKHSRLRRLFTLLSASISEDDTAKFSLIFAQNKKKLLNLNLDVGKEDEPKALSRTTMCYNY